MECRVPSAEYRVSNAEFRVLSIQILALRILRRIFGTRHSALGILLFLLSACQKPALPETDSADYREAVTAFYSSIASIQSGQDAGAERNLQRVTRLAPGEPAAWYNLGLLALRQNQFDAAGEYLQTALLLAPDNNDILRLLGLMEIIQGDMDPGIDYLNRTLAQNPADHKARFALAQERGRSDEPAQWEEAAALYDQLAADLPENLAVQLEKARLASMRGDFESLQAVSNALSGFVPGWTDEIREPYDGLATAIELRDAAAARVQAGFLRNMLLSTYAFRQDLLQVQTPVEQVGDLIAQFILLPAPSSQPAPADMALGYTASEPVSGPIQVEAFQAASLDGERALTEIYRTPAEIVIAGQSFAFTASAIALLDYNYDFLVDAVAAGPAGLQLLRQDSAGRFTGLSTAFDAVYTARSYSGAWAADIDLEGDLDLVLAAEDGPYILRNNGDGAFTKYDLFEEVPGLTDFAWGDFDGDGDPDAALLDAAGELYLYANERMGMFVRQVVPPVFGDAVALRVADPDSDGLLDLVGLMADGSVYALSNQPGEGWVLKQLVRWDEFSLPDNGEAALFLSDFDNNGAIDVLVAGTRSQIWLQTDSVTFAHISSPLAGTVQSVADMNGDGLLDLTGVDESGKPVVWEAEGSMGYHWQVLRPRAGQALGDQRINSFAIGGEVEIRAGLLYQKQPILSPVVHLGLGTHEKTDLARFIWPNGDVQSEFDLAVDQSILTPQRLKGSCPWLFTFDGERMRFVTDFIWRSPLGLRINAQETAGIMTTEDWVKIRGEELAPRDGLYDIRVTAELWETHFFDHVSLMAVDHPADTEIFVDERFAFPSPEMRVHHTSKVRPVERVTTDLGTDATGIVEQKDGQYLDFFGRGAYQGITRDHYIEIELDEAVLNAHDPMLVAFGWVRPTDSSINVAISQGSQAPPHGMRLEVLQVDETWKEVKNNLGFPAGKTKTVLIDLAGVFDETTYPRLRLHTNLEIYWDHIGWVVRTSQDLNVREIRLNSAELVYRGFSRVTAADASSPELPDYHRLAGTSPRWRDLIGYYTRFGAVDELLESVDDRYVIMNAGDEMRFLFEALPAPASGWRRDFVLTGDGWVKDGDYNTAFSKTVLPLPSHEDASYDTPPGKLFEDPVYRLHADDWQKYHTRYVTPDGFRGALAIRD